nr:MAG TPA: repressor domain protein [Caudoviricetes sp.]
MNELQIFKNNTFGNVRVLEQNGEPWFVAKDVCECLDIKNTTDALKRLDDDERARFNLGRQGNTNIVNEYGLYNLVLSSRKPEAKEFKRWITHEVIPSIRKYGSFNMAIPRTLPDALTAYAHEIEAHQKTQALLEAQRPKVLFADSVAASHTSILIGELAKLLHQNGVKDMGQKRLFAWMREHGYLISRKANDYNMPTQRAMELGLFQIKETTVTHSDGHISVSKTPKVTGKGQQYFIEKFLGRR